MYGVTPPPATAWSRRQGGNKPSGAVRRAPPSPWHVAVQGMLLGAVATSDTLRRAPVRHRCMAVSGQLARELIN